MTKLLPRPDVSGLDPDDAARRDYTSETDWFPIFRSGKYSQGTFTAADIDEIVEEFTMHGRRSPIVNDHLTNDDLKAGSKAGSSLGNVIALKAVDSTNPLYPGERELQARAKVGFGASWQTREGARRNVSAGFAKVKSVKDGATRWALHHLALLGAAPPGVMGLPEVVFSDALDDGSEILRFSTDAGIPVPATNESTGSTNQENSVHTIAFTEHQALLAAEEAKLRLSFSEQVTSFQEQIKSLEGQVATFKEDAEKAKADAAAASAATDAAKAEGVIAAEKAKQEGIEQGKKEGLTAAHAMFEEKAAKDAVIAFCEKLHAEGKLTEAEFKGADGKPSMADRILAMPASNRADFQDVLSARSVNLQKPLETPKVVREAPASTEAAFQERVQQKALSLMKAGTYTVFAEAWDAAETELKKGD